jgi:hypothetical protein
MLLESVFFFCSELWQVTRILIGRNELPADVGARSMGGIFSSDLEVLYSFTKFYLQPLSFKYLNVFRSTKHSSEMCSSCFSIWLDWLVTIRGDPGTSTIKIINPAGAVNHCSLNFQ